jgi:hypothetical protein
MLLVRLLSLLLRVRASHSACFSNLLVDRRVERRDLFLGKTACTRGKAWPHLLLITLTRRMRRVTAVKHDCDVVALGSRELAQEHTERPVGYAGHRARALRAQHAVHGHEHLHAMRRVERRPARR